MLLTLICLLLPLAFIYAALFAKATQGVAHTLYPRLNPWDVATVIREARGAQLRKQQGLPSFSSQEDAFLQLGLDRESVTPEQVSAAEAHFQAILDSHAEAYPESQRAMLDNLVQSVLSFMKLRTRLEAEAFARAEAHRQRNRPDWRVALKLSPDESDPQEIKKAYRRLCAKAHPDRGGSSEEMTALSAAMEDARKELNFV